MMALNKIQPIPYLNEIIHKSNNLKMKLIDVNGIEIECNVEDIQISILTNDSVELDITARIGGENL